MLDLFTVVWGPMVNTFARVTVPSLLQPGNIPAAQHHLGTYTIYTDDEGRRSLRSRPVVRRLLQEVTVCFEPLVAGRGNVTHNVVHQLRRAESLGNYVMVMSPDWCLGNNSLRNLAELCAKGESNPILYGFPRLTEIGWRFVEMALKEEGAISNRQLVTLAMKHGEQFTYPRATWVEGDRIVHENTWKTCHNVPTPCLRPDPWVVETFATNGTINSGYDHAMPWMMVEKGYPWYLIRHSDVYFQVERARHLIQEQVADLGAWQRVKAFKGLEFFTGQEAIWQGV